MTSPKWIAILALLVGLLVFVVPPLDAQTVILAVGVPAAWSSAAVAAVTSDPMTGAPAPCGTHIWTGLSGVNGNLNMLVDPRGGPTAGGKAIWVAWDNSAGPTVVCAYLEIGTAVALRMFLSQGATGNGTLHFTSGSAPGNLIKALADTDVSVPAPVAGLINGAHFNLAFSELSPDDEKYVFDRTAVTASPSTFGYNPGCALNDVKTPPPAPTPPVGIYSSFTNNVDPVSCFAVRGVDPISGVLIPPWTTIAIGASPLLLFYNTNGNLAGGTLPTNVLPCTAGLFFSGAIGSSQTVFGAGAVNTVMGEIQNSPLSGSYNTLDWQVVHARDCAAGNYQQENDYNIHGHPTIWAVTAACTPPGFCSNPMENYSSTVNSYRYRAIGPGEPFSAVNGDIVPPAGDTQVADRMGYDFYTLNDFYVPASHLKYVTIAGTDPLYSNYSANKGTFGMCSGAINTSNFQCTTTLPNFANAMNGNYRTWANVRAVAYTPVASSISQFLQIVEDHAVWALNNPGQSGITAPGTIISSYSDFVPTSLLSVFRSHYPINGVDANNGTNPPNSFCAADQASPNCAEEGGDMAGIALQKITDVQYFNLTGGELLTFIE